MKIRNYVTHPKKSLEEAIAVLKQGGVIAHPTDTVWGFAADAENQKAVQKIHALKKSAARKQMLWNLPSKAWLDRVGKKLCKAHKLARKFWPGALSLIIQAKKGGTLGVRYPAHLLSNKLARSFGKPLITTSANLKNNPPARSANEIVKIFRRQKIKPDLILDDAAQGKGQPSTIVDVSTKEVQLIREGAVTFKAIRQALSPRS